MARIANPCGGFAGLCIRLLNASGDFKLKPQNFSPLYSGEESGNLTEYPIFSYKEQFML